VPDAPGGAEGVEVEDAGRFGETEAAVLDPGGVGGGVGAPDEVDGGVGDDARRLDDLVAGALECDAEAGTVRIDAGRGLRCVGDRDP
jgi:hypothetical protein